MYYLAFASMRPLLFKAEHPSDNTPKYLCRTGCSSTTTFSPHFLPSFLWPFGNKIPEKSSKGEIIVAFLPKWDFSKMCCFSKAGMLSGDTLGPRIVFLGESQGWRWLVMVGKSCPASTGLQRQGCNNRTKSLPSKAKSWQERVNELIWV